MNCLKYGEELFLNIIFLAVWLSDFQKKGDFSNVANYRPIAITSVLSKIMEKVINEQALHHLESNNLIHDRQYGFRQFRSTGDILAHITHIWNKWNKALETGKETFVIGLDISKAFDQVWQKNLLAKLPAFEGQALTYYLIFVKLQRLFVTKMEYIYIYLIN